MQLPENPHSFATKILSHYPIPQQAHSCLSHCQHQSNPQQFQPFQHMHDHRKEREIYDKPTHEKLENIRYFKEMGNTTFRDGKYEEASYFYQKAIVYADYTFPESDKQINQMEILVQQANMNLAICLIKQGNWSKAVVNIREASKAQNAEKDDKLRGTVLKTRKKSYYWMTKYYINLGNYENASKEIEKLEKLDEYISCKDEVTELKRQVLQEMRRHQKKTEEVSKKMFMTSC